MSRVHHMLAQGVIQGQKRQAGGSHRWRIKGHMVQTYLHWRAWGGRGAPIPEEDRQV